MPFPRPNMPGIVSGSTIAPRRVLATEEGALYLPHSRVIDGSKARDSGNTGKLDVLRAGLLLGKITSSSKYAPSVLGIMAGAMTGAATTVSVSAAQAVEMVRRNGSAVGTFKFTGPPTANGTVRTLSASVSAIDQTTGALTFTALGVNQVDRIKFNLASTAANLQLTVQKTDGTFVTTANIAWNATDATYLASINSALDTATGVTGGIVATAISAVDTDLGFELTYSGTGYAGQTWTAAQVALFPTTSTVAVYTRITTAVDGRFVAGSFVQPNDGSEAPLTFVPDGTGIKVTDIDGNSVDTQWGRLPVGGLVDSAQILPAWPSDTSLRAWIVSSLRTGAGGGLGFNHLF